MKGKLLAKSVSTLSGDIHSFKRQFSRIQGKYAFKFALAFMLVLGAAHISLGSNPVVPILAILTMALAMWPMARYEPALKILYATMPRQVC